MKQENGSSSASNDLVDAARRFIATMGFSHSGVYGREVPSGFTADSSAAAVALYDALVALDKSITDTPQTRSGASAAE